MGEPSAPGAAVPQQAGWVVVRTAPNQLVAEMWRGLLVDAGIPAALAPADVVSYLGVSVTPCRLLVPGELAARAERVLADAP